MTTKRFGQLLLFLLLLAIVLPSVLMNWSLVDDGVLIQKSHQLSVLINKGEMPGTVNFFLEKDIGRFRPTYYLYYLFVYFIGGTNVFIYYLFHLLNFVLIIFLIYKICQILFSNEVGLWAIFFFAASYLNLEHWYRLGPQEPFMLAFFLSSLYLFISVLLKLNKSIVYKIGSIIFLVLAYLTKESSLAYGLLIIIFYLLIKKVKIKGLKQNQWDFSYFRLYFWANIFLTICLGLASLLLKQSGSYVQGYALDFPAIGRVFVYLKVLSGSFIPVFPFLIIFSFFKCLKKSLWYLFFFLWFLFFLMIQSPWNFVLSRYLMPSSLGLAVMMGFSVKELLYFLKKRAALKKITVILIVIVFVFQNLFRGANYILWTLSNSNNTAHYLANLALLAKPNSTVYLNMEENNSTAELFVETGLHLNIIFNRPDVKISYFENFDSLKQEDLIVSAFLDNNLLKYENSLLEKKPDLDLLRREVFTFYSLPDYSLMGLVKQLKNEKGIISPTIRRTPTEWLIYKHK